MDLVQLSAFLRTTQPEVAESLGLSEDGPTRRKFLARLQGEISKRGTINVLRHGIGHGAHDLTLFYGTPSAGNEQAKERFEAEPLHCHPGNFATATTRPSERWTSRYSSTDFPSLPSS